MKPIRNLSITLFILTIFVALFSLVHAQETSFSISNLGLASVTDVQAMMEALTTVDPVPFTSLPRNRFDQVISGGFWSAQHLPGSNAPWPPLPGNFWNLDVWPLGDGIFILDDRALDYAALQAEMEAAAALDSPSLMMRSSLMMSSLSSSYAYGNPVYLTNLVVSAAGYQPMSASFDIVGGTNFIPYDIVTTTNLATSVSQWTWLGIGYTANHYTFSNQPLSQTFYILAKPAKTMTVGFGTNDVAQCDVPYGLTNALQVTGGDGHSLALKNDGTVMAWGMNDYGQANVPTNLTGVAMIAAGSDYSAALRTNGTVLTWGSNLYGERNVPSDLTNTTVISAQAYHTLALRSDGTVVSWGYDTIWGETNVPVGLSNVTAIAAGFGHNLAISNGWVVAWGYNDYGQCNIPAGLSNVVDVAAGLYHSVALLKNGTVVAWGGNGHGETNVPAGLTNVVTIVAGGDLYSGENSAYSLALKSDGTVVAWGDGPVLHPVGGLNNVVAIGGGLNYALAVRTGPPTPVITLEPSDQYRPPGGNVTFTARGAGLYGVTYQWQTNGVNLSGATNAALALTNVQASQTGAYHVVVTDNRGMGSIVSSNATLYLVTPPVITYQSQPTNVVCIYGNHVAFTATATALGQLNGFPLTYQWKLNGTNIPSATTNNYAFYANDNSSGTYSIVVANAGGSTNVSWQVTVTNAINVTNDLLLIYNTNSMDSATVLNYYLLHRPMVSGANVMGIGCSTNETIAPSEFTNSFIPQIQTWLTNNPTKQPQYVVLFLDIPSRVHTNTTPGDYHQHDTRPSVQYQIATGCEPTWQPFVTSINMNGTNDCIAYINKLAQIGTNYSPGKLIISAAAGGYGNTNYVLDGIRYGGPAPLSDFSGSGYVVSRGTNGLTPNNIKFFDGLEILSNNIVQNLPHPTGFTNMAGYISWGEHSSLAGYYPINGTVKWNGNSSWWIIETVESFNGWRTDPGQGTFIKWFSSNAFGGTNYSNTPVGAVSHVEEPFLTGIENSSIYFGFWAGGKNFAVCAWSSRQTIYFQAVGDPLIER